MGLLQKAVETYDFRKDCVGRQQENQVPLAPIAHMITAAALEITVDGRGTFVSARPVEKSEPKIIIPVTEESAGRSGKDAYKIAHPLCEKLSYYTAEENYFIPELEKWAASAYAHPMLLPILTYLKSGTVEEDLMRCGIKVNPSDLVRWRVIGPDGVSRACWKEPGLFEAFTRYYLSKIAEREKRVCMISGEEAVAAKQHPKGVVAISGNAKLISANDKSGFTYRGRFTEDWQAAAVSYISSQKAHNALRWLIAEQGELFGGRTFLCWNPRGTLGCTATGPFQRKERFAVNPSDYREGLHRTLIGYRSTLPEKDWVVIAVFDAATTGRLAVTYFNELQGSDFLQRLYSWDAHCCWYNGPYGIQSPSLLQIVNGAFGVQRAEKGKKRLVADDRILGQQIQRVMACRIDGARMSATITKALMDRVSNPQAYDDAVWRKLVYTACAVLNYNYYMKGEDAMSWKLDKRDRSFQFGRLLAAMERLEEDYYFSKEEKRQTNAIKSLNVFRLRPFHTYERVNRHLEMAYVPRVKEWQRARYERCRQEIMGIIRELPEEDLNKPLEDVYLMGYECQRMEFFKKHEQNTEEE